VTRRKMKSLLCVCLFVDEMVFDAIETTEAYHDRNWAQLKVFLIDRYKLYDGVVTRARNFRPRFRPSGFLD